MRVHVLANHGGAGKSKSGMTRSGDIVRVPAVVADLVPRFMKTRRKEIPALRAAIAACDFEQSRKIGYRMRGIGGSYGFDQVSSLGRRIEESAESKDLAALKQHLLEYTAYLSTVRIITNEHGSHA